MSHNRNVRIISVLLACILMLNQIPVFAAAEDIGSGSANVSAGTSESGSGPYAISTKAELNAIRDNLSGSYYLTRDIVFTESDYLEGGAFYNDGAGWEPIGTEEARFSGVLDGRGYSIVGLKTSGKDYAGLFAYLSGTVTNLTMKDVSVSGSWRSGAIAAAAMESATVTNCTVYGSVVTSSNQYNPAAAGFVGMCYENWKVPGGTILFENCHNHANVDVSSTSSSDAYGGGIYGLGAGTGQLKVNVIRCSNHGNIAGAERVGGIAGISEYRGEIVECYNTGAITSSILYSYVGGICGVADGYSSTASKIMNCYNAGTVTAVSYAGGIAGGYHQVTIEGCYNVGALSATDRYGIGKDSTTGQDQVLLNNYTISPYYLTYQNGWPVYTNWSDTEMRQQETYQGFDFENTWFLDANTDYPYPQLIANVQNPVMSVSVETQPDCAVFVEGRKPDLTGATAKITYKSGVTAIMDITEKMLWDIDYGRPGQQEVHVHYAGVTSGNALIFDITSKNIELTSLPDKLVYLEGKDALDMSGAELTVTYGDGSSEVIAVTESMVSGFDNTVVGIQTLTVAFEEKTVTFEIEVKAKSLVEIRVATLPLKLTYVQGQPIDPDGGVLELVYDNDTVERKALALAQLTVSPEAIGETPVTVSYGGQETTFPVCVEPRVAKSVVITLPEKREYAVGEELDLAGGMITAVFESEDDYTETVAVDASMVSGYDSTTPGRQTLTVTYLGYTEQFDVFVHTVVNGSIYHPPVVDSATVTCTQSGLSEGSHCEICDKVLVEQVYTEALGHDFGEWYSTEDATCTQNGEQRRDCSRCDQFETREASMLGHDYRAVVTEPTCTEDGYTVHTCTRCNDTYTDSPVDALGHDFGAWYTVKDAACTEDGQKRRDCSRCDHYETQNVAKLGHDYTAVVTEPTCTGDGYTVHTCTRCNDTYTDNPVDALGHDLGAWYTVKDAACAEDGQKRRDCSRCDHYETDALPKLGHDYTAVVTDPTCTADGYTVHTCTRCNDTYTDNPVDALGHDLGEWYTVKDAACAEDGQERRDCSRCDHYETQNVAKLGHDYESVITDPTCTEGGYTTHTCTRCQDSYTDAYADALGHEMGQWYFFTAATCTEDGQERRLCTRCDHYETQTVPKLGHDYEPVISDPTCTEGGYTTHTCTRCGDAYTDSPVAALGHDWKAAGCDTPKTCNRCGITDGSALGHDWQDAACTTPKTCSRCGNTDGTALGHDYADGICTRCGGKDPGYVPPTPDVIRLSGKNRVLTSFAVADELKDRMGIARFDTVVVAYGRNFPDALAGSYLAARKNAPILLTDNSSHADVVSYITLNMEFDGTVYILGGTGAVSQDFEDRLIELDINYKRLKGSNRYLTNLEILKEAGISSTDEVLIATGTNFADSLSASATGLPIVLVGKTLTQDQKDFLATTSRKFVIIGGTGAVSEAVETELAQIGAVERIKGKSRYETSVVIAQRYFTNPTAAILAYAQDFPDGLCGGPLAYRMGAPLILTSNGSYVAADAYIEGILSGAVTGGTGRLTDETVRDIFDLAADTEIPKK